MARLLFMSLLGLQLFVGSFGQVDPPIPLLSIEPGVTLGNGLETAQVKIEAFLEPLCSDSVVAYPVLQQVASHYQNSQVRVVIHLQALPYHRNAFISLQGFHMILERYGATDAFNYLEEMLANSGQFGTSATTNKTQNQIVTEMGDLADRVTAITSLEFVASYNNYYSTTVRDWKYNVRRGVAGTPWYYVNGVDICRNPSTFMSFDDWTTLIDSLLLTKRKQTSDQQTSTARRRGGGRARHAQVRARNANKKRVRAWRAYIATSYSRAQRPAQRSAQRNQRQQRN